MGQAARYVLYGQACFYGGLLICAVLKPQGLTANGGISYYGIYSETILPYALALAGSAYFLIKTAELYKQPSQKIICYALTAFGLLTIGVLITPDSLNPVWLWDGVHRAFGIPLFSLQLLFSGWLVVHLRYRFWAVLLIAVEFAGGLFSLIWLSPIHGWSFESQVVFQAGFGGLLIYSLPRLSFANKNA